MSAVVRWVVAEVAWLVNDLADHALHTPVTGQAPYARRSR